MTHGGEYPEESILLTVNGNGNGQVSKILWWIVNVLLGIGTTVLTILYMSLMERINTIEQHMSDIETQNAIRGERIRAVEIRQEIQGRDTRRR